MNGTHTDSPFFTRHRHLVIILIVGLVARLLFLFMQHYADPLLFVPSVDEQTYVQDAARWADAGFAPSGLKLPFWQPPGYMFILAGWIAIGGTSTGFILLQLALGLGSSVFIYFIVIRLFGDSARRAGFIAALVYNVFPSILYYETKLLKPTLVIFLMLVLFMLAVPRARWWFMKGILSGVVILFDLYFVVLPVALLLRTGWRYRNAAYLAAGLVLVVVPVTWLNTRHGGEFIPVSYNGPINLYIGNNADWLSTYNTLPGLPWYRITLMHEAKAAKDPESARFGKYFLEDVRDYVLTQPLSMVQGLGTKALLFFSAREMPRNGAFMMFIPVKWYGAMLNALLIAAALLAIPALRREPLIFLPVLAIFAINVLFFPTSRYRLPAIPLALIATGIFAVQPVRWVKRTCTFALVLAAGATVLAFRVIKYDDWRAFSYNEAAWAEIDKGHHGHAVDMIAKALDASRLSSALDTAGQIAVVKQGDSQKGARLFDEAIAAEPENPTPHFNQARVKLQAGEMNEAYRQFDEYLRLVRPDLPSFSEKEARACYQALEVTSRMDFEQGRVRQARQRLVRLRQLSKKFPIPDITISGLDEQIRMIDRMLEQAGPVR